MRVAALGVIAAACVTGRAVAQDPAQQQVQQQIFQEQIQISIQAAQLATQQANDAAMRAGQMASSDAYTTGWAYNGVIPPAKPDPSVTAIPTFWPKPGPFNGRVTVSISNVTPYATVYYTTDGTVPTTRSARYTGPITLTTSGKILAVAVAPDLWQSPIAIGAYEVHSSK